MNQGTIASPAKAGPEASRASAHSTTKAASPSSRLHGNAGFRRVSNNGASPVVNNGTIAVRSGAHLIIDGPLPLEGSGSLIIGNHATLELADAVANGVHFATGAVGTLQLDVAAGAAFTGTVFGLALGDAIDFTNSIITSTAVDGNNILTVTLEGGQPSLSSSRATCPRELRFRRRPTAMAARNPSWPMGRYRRLSRTPGSTARRRLGHGGRLVARRPDGKSDAAIAGSAT